MSSKEPKESVTIKRYLQSIFWVLATYWRNSRTLTVAALVTSSGQEITNIISAYVLAKGIDTLISVSEGRLGIEHLYFVIAIFALLSVINAILRFASSYSRRMLSTIFFPRFQELLYKKLISLGINKLEDPELNNLVERARGSTGQIEFVFSQMTSMIGNVTSIITTTSILMFFAPQLIPLFIVVLIPSILLDRHYMKTIWKYGRDLTEERRSAQQSASYLQDSKTLHELLITNGHTFLSKHFEKFANKYIEGMTKIRKSWNLSVFGFRFLRIGVEAYADWLVFTRFLAKNNFYRRCYFLHKASIKLCFKHSSLSEYN